MVFPKECEKELILAVNRYADDESFPDDLSPFATSLNALEYEMNHMVEKTPVGLGLMETICLSKSLLESDEKSKGKF